MAEHIDPGVASDFKGLAIYDLSGALAIRSEVPNALVFGSAAALSPDGSRVVSVAGGIDVWDLATGSTPGTNNDGDYEGIGWASVDTVIGYHRVGADAGRLVAIDASTVAGTEVATGLPEPCGGQFAASPAGELVAACRPDDGDSDQLFLFPAGGGPAQQLTFESAQLETPQWSPDGSRIAVTVFGSGLRNVGIVTVSDGSSQEIDVPGNAFAPTWVDADTLLYATDEGGSTSIRMWTQDGGDQVVYSAAGPAQISAVAAVGAVFDTTFSGCLD